MSSGDIQRRAIAFGLIVAFSVFILGIALNDSLGINLDAILFPNALILVAIMSGVFAMQYMTRRGLDKYPEVQQPTILKQPISSVFNVVRAVLAVFFGVFLLVYGISVIKIGDEHFSRINAACIASIVTGVIAPHYASRLLVFVVFIYVSYSTISYGKIPFIEIPDILLGIWIGWLLIRSAFHRE
jgi:hypothetical protein